ncbi:hypothetical protein [Lacticaseibacillus nasuensis]|uniref:hypothetical protein n=1 Tax=Lacticaseibacillus nasuensis TaxID=944671 RepID=UPI002247FA20|nr:hypothetical protein [Lacticaseibacillus nasuensis]MCX2454622.1 hypothetical protein [Lacticaseibacillus nasuensis]
MKVKPFVYGLWGVSFLAVVFAIAILLIPADQFHMVLNLRNGHEANPGRWLVVLPIIVVGLNLASLRERRKDPTTRDEWPLLIAELVLMGICTVQQFLG